MLYNRLPLSWAFSVASFTGQDQTDLLLSIRKCYDIEYIKVLARALPLHAIWVKKLRQLPL